MKAAFREFTADDVPQLAAALSYYAVFSLAPMLMLVVMAAGVFLDPDEVSRRIVVETSGAVGPDAARQIETMLERAGPPETGGALPTALGIAAFMFGATALFAQLQKALNRVWGVGEARRGGLAATLVARVLSFGLVLLVAVLLLASLALSTLVSALGETVAGTLPAPASRGVLQAASLALSLAVVTALFAVLYRVLPDAEIAWKDVRRGALLTGILFIAGQFALGLYVARSDPGSAFGAAGSLALLLVWIYYSAMIFLLGAEFTYVWARRRGREIRPA